MKIYVACKFEDTATVQSAIAKLRAAGHTITYDWSTAPLIQSIQLALERDAEEAKQAIADLQGVVDADAIIMFPRPGAKGSWVEVGIALQAGKHVVIVGKVDDPGGRCIFEALTLPHSIQRVKSMSQALELLEGFEGAQLDLPLVEFNGGDWEETTLDFDFLEPPSNIRLPAEGEGEIVKLDDGEPADAIVDGWKVADPPIYKEEVDARLSEDEPTLETWRPPSLLVDANGIDGEIVDAPGTYQQTGDFWPMDATHVEAKDD